MAKAKPGKRDAIPPLEWAAAAFGLLVAIVLLSIIGRGVVAGGHEVPHLAASAERVFATPTGHVVEVVAVNRSSVSAASVQVEGVVGQGADEETSIASIDYVPGHSRATGGLLFTRDPKADGLRLRVTGYELP